jgi:hypothetical protein
MAQAGLIMAYEYTTSEPHSTFLGEIDPDFALENAHWIRKNIPLYDLSNTSGKFYRNYESYAFWKDSSQPLIKAFVESIIGNEKDFHFRHKKRLDLSFIYLSYVKDSSESICIKHKDGYWWDGQFHLTIQGNSNIEIEEGSLTSIITAKPGSIWYLNSSNYLHKIATTNCTSERFELLAPCGFREESRILHEQATTSTTERWIDSTHEAMVAHRKAAMEHMDRALKNKTASNLDVAAWSLRYEKDK